MWRKKEIHFQNDKSVKKGRLVILIKLFGCKPGSTYEKIIRETYTNSHRNEHMTIHYSVKENDLKAYTEEKNIFFPKANEYNTIAYHNAIHQLIKKFDEKYE